jgi:hypothetical protein
MPSMVRADEGAKTPAASHSSTQLSKLPYLRVDTTYRVTFYDIDLTAVFFASGVNMLTQCPTHAYTTP